MDNDSPKREASPDWLHAFETPLKDFKTLSSSSTSTSSHGEGSKERPRFRTQPQIKLDPDLADNSKDEISSAHPLERKAKFQGTKAVDLDSDSDQSEREKGVLTGTKPIKGTDAVCLEKQNRQAEQRSTDKRKEKAEEPHDHLDGLLKLEGATLSEEVAGEGQERRTKRALSTLPLVFGDKVHRSKVLLECEGDALDVGGDIGVIGRLGVSANHDNDFLLDLKGIIYKANIVPSNSFFVVNIGQTEAKVEAIMNDFVQLQPSGNVFESEMMVEGTLEGFAFDSDEDRDFIPVAAGVVNTAKHADESKDEKKQGKQKSKPNKPLKVLKGSIKKVGKSKSGRAAGKGGGPTRKSAKKTNTTKQTGK